MRDVHNVQINVAAAVLSAGICVLVSGSTGAALIAAGVTLTVTAMIDVLFGT